MAKLSAHGTEMLRVEKFHKTVDERTVRTTMVFMSDGTVLKKKDFIVTNPCQRRPGTGWKLVGRVYPPENVPADEYVERVRRDWESSGFRPVA